MGNQQYLFNRAWSVTIGFPGQQGYTYTGLRTVFDIEKINVGVANKASVSLYNLNETSRKFFQAGMQLQLQAGYQGLMETIYVGDIALNGVHSKREGSSIVTTFECGDSEKQLNLSHFDKSYPSGTHLYQVLQDLAQALGIGGVGVVIGIPDFTYQNGYVASGTVAHVLDELTTDFDMDWSVHNGTLNIIPKNAHLGDQAIVISQDTGMIGIPTKGDIFTKVDSLLNPKIVPGCLVQIVSNTINDFFKVQKAHFKGDSHSTSDWTVGVECFKIDAVQTLPMNHGFNFLSAVKSG